MNLLTFIEHVNRGALIQGGSEAHAFMHGAAQEALQVVAEINTGYRTPDEIRALLSRLTGRQLTSRSRSFRRSTASSARTSGLAEASSSTSGAAFKTPAASPSATAHSSATAAPSQRSTTPSTRTNAPT